MYTTAIRKNSIFNYIHIIGNNKCQNSDDDIEKKFQKIFSQMNLLALKVGVSFFYT